MSFSSSCSSDCSLCVSFAACSISFLRLCSFSACATAASLPPTPECASRCSCSSASCTCPPSVISRFGSRVGDGAPDATAPPSLDDAAAASPVAAGAGAGARGDDAGDSEADGAPTADCSRDAGLGSSQTVSPVSLSC